MTENGYALKGIQTFIKLRDTPQGKELIKTVLESDDSEGIFPPLDKDFVNEMQRAERLRLVAPRIYVDTICPHCGRQHPFSFADEHFHEYYMTCLLGRIQCPCGKIYVIGEGIIYEKPWIAYITFGVIVVIILSILLATFA